MDALLMVLALELAAAPTTLAGNHVAVGEGWGCALVVADRKYGWECWQAGPSVQAWRVPWLDGRGVVAGPDRLCAVEAEDVGCIEPPRRGDRAARPIGPLPPPRRAPDAGASDGGDRHSFYDDSGLYEGLVGGTFACPSKKNDIWCAGDNSFGQLGYSGTPATRPPLLRMWITENVGLGAWHGCAWKGGGPPASEGLYCWGRGDGGQLGVPAPDVCKVGGKDVACARKPIRVPVDFRLPGLGYAPNRGRGDLRGGDMFTCARPPHNQTAGIVCWGASRDGLFGTAALCPPGLSSAWPTRRGGTIAAPGAACSPTPVAIAGSDRFKRSLGPTVGGKPTSPPEITDNFDIGPRGLCMVSEAGEIWCKGAIPTPRNLVATSVSVSPGENASACAATKDGGLSCWGEGYSPASALDRPVAIAFEPLPPPPANPNPAPIDSPARPLPWGKSCAVHRTCERGARPIPDCSSGTQGITAEAAAQAAEGTIVSVRGPLRAGPGFTTKVGCSEVDPETQKPRPVQACCNHVNRRIVVGDGKGILLGGIGCLGDESRVCCDVPVRGQTVIATGKLRSNPDALGIEPKHQLDDVKICNVPDVSIRRPSPDGGVPGR